MPKVLIELQANTQDAVNQIQRFAKAQKDAFDAVRAGNPALADARVKVSQLSAAHADVTRSTNQWANALGQLPGPMGEATRLTSQWIGLLKGPAGLAVGLGAVAAAGIGLAKSMANTIERLDNLSRVTGLSVAALESFEHIAKQAGAAPEELARGLGAINTAISDVIKGGDSASKTFQTIGVDLRSLVKSGQSTEQILEVVAKAISGIEDPTRQAAAMADIFGVRSKALQIALQRVATDGIGPLIEEMKRLGVVTSQSTIDAARHVDQMADRFDASIDRMIKKLKQYAVEAASDLAKVGNITGQLFGPGAGTTQEERLANAARLGRELRNQIDRAGEDRTTRAGLPTAGPRVVADTAAEIAAAKKAAEEAKRIDEELFKHKIQGLEAFKKEQEEAAAGFAAIDDRANQQRIDAEAGTRAAIAKIQIQAIDDYEARQEERQRLDVARREARFAAEIQTNEEIKRSREEMEVGISAVENRAREQKLAILTDTATGRIRLIVEERQKIRDVLDQGVDDVKQAEELKLKILELTLAKEVELQIQGINRELEIRIAAQERMNHVLELQVTANQRAEDAILRGQILAAKGSGDAWGAFSKSFEREALSWGTTMDRFAKSGALVAQDLHNAFSDTFFDAMKGDLQDLDDVWKSFLDAILRHIADFLAAEAVTQLLNLGKEIGSGLSSSSTTSASSGGGGIDWANIVASIGSALLSQQKSGLALEQQTTAESQKRLSLEQSRTGEASHQLTLEEARNAGGRAGRAVGGALGGMAGAGLGGLGGPLGAIGGGLAGRFGGGKLGELLGDLLGDLLGLQDKVEQLGMSSTDLAKAIAEGAIAANTAMNAIDRNTEATTDLTAVTNDLTAAQTDLAIQSADLVSVTNTATAEVGATTAGLGQFGTAVGDMSDAIADAVAAANQAAETAQAAAGDAAASADRAADAGRGFGGHPGDPVGTPGGGPSGPGAGVDPGQGGGAGPSPDPGQGGSDRLHGGWIGVRGFAPGGWVTDGQWGRDSVMARLARGEFVLNSQAANYDRQFTEAYNRNPAAAMRDNGTVDPVEHHVQVETTPEERAEQREQTRLMAKLVAIVERSSRSRGGRIAGDGV